MCGFVGLLNWDGLSGEADGHARAMADAIAHRGPDDEGFWRDPNGCVIFGHRRLAIVDLSAAGHQPMDSRSGRWTIAFNGEIYNHESLRAELERGGWALGWRGHSDTEVMLAAFEVWGVEGALQKCVGMFAFALWDRETKTLTLGRDRLGEKPLYYGWLRNTLVFGSELASFYCHPDWHGEIDRGALALLMRHNYIPAPYSVFKGVSKLPPATVARFSKRGKEPEIREYWSLREVAENAARAPFAGTPEQAVDEVERLLRQALQGQMMADVPLGAFLSGGIDSSTVVAVMQSLSKQPVRTFSIGFDVPGYNEAEHAKAVAKHLGTSHTELYVTSREALDVVPKLPSIYSEPFSDSSQIPTYLVSKLAREHVTVSLSGDGGDELFSGYSRYAVSEALWGRISLLPASMRAAFAAGIRAVRPSVWNGALALPLRAMPARYQFKNPGDKLHKFADLLGLKTHDDVYRRLVSHWQAPETLIPGAKEPPTWLTRRDGVPSSMTDVVRRMMFLDSVSYLPDDILVKVDRASMAVSLESRVPMLDHRIVEFASTLPMSILRHEGVAKWPLRQVLYRYVPKELIDRPKMGFGVPLDAWLRGPLREWGESLINDCARSGDGLFNADEVRLAWQEHQSGARNWQYQLWDVLMFQAWHSQYREHQGARAMAGV
ncbi:asparagine synthase (glutamine-hydrolyzing) [Trinickia sp. NRRL B-1857]|uniref:asparagine synthase (glutamine-hydrolyzing) n=1 Tax=Trinickia sp. NRRL B-1857 TaxID=3162879 RepID=UPI003D2CC842